MPWLKDSCILLQLGSHILVLVCCAGMGLLEEEGFGWKGISLPQIEDLWGLAASAIYGVHIFRAEGHSTRVDPLSLTAVQCGTLAALSILWEACRLSQNPSTNCRQYLMQLQSLPWCPLVYSGLVCAGLCSWLELRGLRSVPASTVTMINTTIPIWGAFLSFLLRGDVPGESAVLGGSVILCASLFAQIATKQDNLNAPKITCKAQTFEYRSLSGRNSETSKSRAYDHRKEPRANAGSTAKRFTPADHVQGAIISSQLKFPYYAAQVKKLLAEVKLKLASAKSAVVSLHAFVSTSSIVSNQSQPAAGTAVHASTTASSAISAAASVHQAVNNVVAGAGISASTPTAQVPLQVITSGVPQLPHASTYMQSAPQWLDSMVVALINSLGTATTGLECTAIALGSDVMQAVEHAEGIVNLAENLLQHILYAAASLASTVTFQAFQMTSSLTANNLPSLLQFDVIASLVDESTLGVNSLDSVIPLLLYHSHLVEQPSLKLLANLSNIYHS